MDDSSFSQGCSKFFLYLQYSAKARLVFVKKLSFIIFIVVPEPDRLLEFVEVKFDRRCLIHGNPVVAVPAVALSGFAKVMPFSYGGGFCGNIFQLGIQVNKNIVQQEFRWCFLYILLARGDNIPLKSSL